MSDAPLPPPELGARVFSVPIGDYERAYDELGAQTMRKIVELVPDDFEWDGAKVLDFGSGPGRTLRHFMPMADKTELWGADIHEPSIDWMRDNLSPQINAWQSAHMPPLGLEHGTFDLIYSVSVFTHLADGSLPWLLELHRLLKPGGIMIATYMGRWNSNWFAGEEWVEDRIGMSTLYRHRDWDSGGPAVLMSDWWVDEHWGRLFDIVDRDPQFHSFTWVVCRKKDVQLSTDEVAELSDDPREIPALRHQIVQLQRTHELEVSQTREVLQGQIAERDERIAALTRELEALRASKGVRAAGAVRGVLPGRRG